MELKNIKVFGFGEIVNGIELNSFTAETEEGLRGATEIIKYTENGVIDHITEDKREVLIIWGIEKCKQ